MRHSFPNDVLRRRLRSLQIGLIFHERECLVAMVERLTGFRLSEDWTPDELAEIVISLEENRLDEDRPQRQRPRPAPSASPIPG